MEAIDLWLLHLCNHWVARSAEAFYQADITTDQAPWTIAAFALVSLWFVGRSDAAATPNQLKARVESRRQFILLFVALVAGFLLSQGGRVLFSRLRPLLTVPLEVPINMADWEEIKSAFKIHDKGFPSDHAVMFAIVTLGVFLVNRWLGCLALLFNLYFCVLRIGIGYHYPADMLVGELFGIVVAFGLLALKTRLQPLLDWILTQFDQYPVVTYPLGFLIMVDFSNRFSGLFYILHSIVGI